MKKSLAPLKIFALFFLIAFLRYIPNFFNNEIYWLDSAVNGNFAYHFEQGKTIMPYIAYQYPPWLHGSFVINILLVPLYFLGKPFYGWISLIGLLVSSAIFAITMSLSIGETKQKQLWVAAFAFILFFFPPPVFTYHARTLCATHFESSLFFLIALSLSCWIAKRDDLKTPLFGFGLLLGFSCFFCYSSFVFAIALTISLWILKGGKFLRNSWLFAIGFLIGFSPAIAYNLTYQNVILNKYLSFTTVAASYPEASQGKGALAYSLFTLFSKVVPRFFSGAELTIQSAIFAALLCFSFIWLLLHVVLKREREPLELALLSTFIIYLIFYALGPFAIFDYNRIFFYRYIVFLYPAMVLTIALFLRRFGILSVVIAIILATGTGLNFSYPTADGFSFRFKQKKGYDLVRLYTDSMQLCISRLESCQLNNVAERIDKKLSGFERAVALGALGSERFNTFKGAIKLSEGHSELVFKQHDSKWLALGWGMAQEDCISQSTCSMPLPALLSEDEKRWFATGFVLRHFLGKSENESSFKEGEEAIIDKLNASSFVFALGFSAGDSIYPLPPVPAKPEDQLQVIRAKLSHLGGLENPSIREKFWQGVGCETAYWFLTENFLMREVDYERLMTPPQSLDRFKPDAESLAIGWRNCLSEFGCKQSAYETKAGKVIKVTCEGEEF